MSLERHLRVQHPAPGGDNRSLSAALPRKRTEFVTSSKGQQATAALFLLKQLKISCPLARMISCVILLDVVDLLNKLIKLIELTGQLVD